jgi:glyoxylase-like metal-dependent hydrolase (beta-lactamase superfamily II)
MRSNVYFVRSGSSWVLIDTASAHCERVIQEAAEIVFGPHTPPAAILLTHDHPDHAGSTLGLARTWGCWAYVHPEEWPLVSMDPSTYLVTVKQYANPLDRYLILPLLHLTPPKRRASMLAQSSFIEVLRALDPCGDVPGLPDWQCIPTPGHTPGHVSFFHPVDRILISGDAVLSVQLNSFWGVLRWGLRRSTPHLAGPPRYSTWRWQVAKRSIETLAQLEPRVLACGHGPVMTGQDTARALWTLADHVR